VGVIVPVVFHEKVNPPSVAVRIGEGVDETGSLGLSEQFENRRGNSGVLRCLGVPVNYDILYGDILFKETLDFRIHVPGLVVPENRFFVDHGKGKEGIVKEFEGIGKVCVYIPDNIVDVDFHLLPDGVIVINEIVLEHLRIIRRIVACRNAVQYIRNGAVDPVEIFFDIAGKIFPYIGGIYPDRAVIEEAQVECHCFGAHLPEEYDEVGIDVPCPGEKPYVFQGAIVHGDEKYPVILPEGGNSPQVHVVNFPVKRGEKEEGAEDRYGNGDYQMIIFL
jgi:hypothetical protein